MQWTRTKQWAAVGILVVAATTMVTAGTAGARGDGRWPASLPAQVNLDSVAQCVQRMSAERLTRLVCAHLEGLPIEVDEPTLHFHVWDALVATCRDHARDHGWSPREPVRAPRGRQRPRHLSSSPGFARNTAVNVSGG